MFFRLISEGVFLSSMHIEKFIPSNINTLLCFAWEGQAVPCSAPWRFVTTEREINTFLKEVRWAVIHNPSDFAVWVWSFGRIKCHDRNRAHNDTSAESQTSQGRQPAWRGRWKAYVCSQAQFILLPDAGEVVSNTANLSQNSVPLFSGTCLWLFIREIAALWWKVINRK